MIKKIFVFLLFSNLPFIGLSQINVDSLFTSAISHAQDQNYTEALEEAEKILEADSSRYDVMVFIANVNAWDGDYNTALNYIEQARRINPEYPGLYDSWLNILLWSERYKALLDRISLARKHDYPDSYNLALKTMLAYKGLGRYPEGIDYVEKNSSLLDSSDIRSIYTEMMMLDRQNILSAFYSLDVFENNNPEPYHLAYLDYGFRIDRHTLLTRFNYAHRFSTSDLQLEADYYHVLNNGHYLYTNYGFGINQRLFPRHRAGLEYYFPVKQGLEASLGGRYFYGESRQVYIATGHVGKYFPNLWLAFRPFFVFGDNANALTTILNLRHYQTNPVNYWGVEIAYGNSPDERYAVDPSLELLRLNSYRLKLEKNIQMGQVNELKLSAGYAYEEHIPEVYRNRFLMELIFKYRL